MSISHDTHPGDALFAWSEGLPDGQAILEAGEMVATPEQLRALAVELAEGDLERLHERAPQELLAAVDGFRRIAAQAQQLMADAAAALAQHPQLSRGRDSHAADELAASEVAVATGTSLRQGRELVARGRATSSWLDEVGQEARAGRLDPARVRAFVEELCDSGPEAVFAVLDQLVPKAGRLTAYALRRLVRRVLAQVDPGGEAERAKAWVAQRCVRPVRPEARGLGLFSALLPAAGAVSVEAACEAAAKAARASGDGRPLEQLRADALVAMGQQALITGTIGVEGLTDEVFSFDPRSARVRLVATKEAESGQPVLDPEFGLSGVEPYVWEFGAEWPPKPDEPWPSIPMRPPPRPGVEVPELAGFGAITPREAAALVNRRWVSIHRPASLGVGPPPDSPGYRPSRTLLDYVRARDHECQAPGCAVPARRCDAHHVVEWPAGPTSATNLRMLCRHHHRLVTHEGHEMAVLDDGAVRWTTALGQAWFAVPDGRVLGADGYERWRPDRDPDPEAASGRSVESGGQGGSWREPERDGYDDAAEDPWWLDVPESPNEYWLHDPLASDVELALSSM